MKPDKIYLGIQDLGSGYVYNISLDNNGEHEYIRKDIVDETIKSAEEHAYFAGQEKFREKLIEWLENKIKIPDVSFINGLTYLAYKDVIEHINEM